MSAGSTERKTRQSAVSWVCFRRGVVLLTHLDPFDPATTFHEHALSCEIAFRVTVTAAGRVIPGRQERTTLVRLISSILWKNNGDLRQMNKERGEYYKMI